jgi:spore coat polysaccharide biosynthesis protein SpsF
MSKKIIAIIQARMGSTRLPGKVMMKINGKPILEHVIERVLESKLISDLVVATTTLSLDDEIESYSKKNKIKIFRGDSNDVLDRFYRCSKLFKANIIIRISADSPLIDPLIIDKCISKFHENKKLDYLSNTINKKNNYWCENYNGFPIGIAVEVFRFKALEKAWRESSSLSDREHVTEYIWKNSKFFNLDYVENENNKSDLRLVVDTKEDFNFIKKFIESHSIDKSVTFNQLINIIDNGSLIRSNSGKLL